MNKVKIILTFVKFEQLKKNEQRSWKSLKITRKIANMQSKECKNPRITRFRDKNPIANKRNHEY
jgi:hypothetical protein